jgi:hypothetical protein
VKGSDCGLSWDTITRIWLEGQRKTIKSFTNDSQCSGQNLNWTPSEHKTEELPLDAVLLDCSQTPHIQIKCSLLERTYSLYYIYITSALWVDASRVEVMPLFQYTQQSPYSGWVWDERGSEPVYRFHDRNKRKVWSMVYPVARNPAVKKGLTAPHFSPWPYSHNKTYIYISVHFLILPTTQPRR